jgi:hypothetical protein
MFSKYDEHINGTFLLQNFGCLGSLVIEGNVGTDVLHELNLLVRTSGADDLEALGFRNLDDKSTSTVCFMNFSNREERVTYDPTGPAPVETKTVSPLRSG